MQYKNHSEGKENRPICLAIGKYGIDNFSFEIIDEVKTQGEADEKERYYIEYYHCLTSEYGYNITKGGKGYDGRRTEIHKIDWPQIKKEIKEDIYLSLQEIADKHDVSLGMIKRVNQGRAIYDENEHYPLRPQKNYVYAKDRIFYLLQNTDVSFEDIAKETNSSVDTVKYINSGRRWHDSNIKYPIRHTKSIPDYVEGIKRDLKNTDLSMIKLGKKYGVSSATVANINKGVCYREEDIKYPIRETKKSS